MDYSIESIQGKTVNTVDLEKIYKKNQKRLEEKVIKSIQEGIGTESNNFEDFFDRILKPEFEDVYFIYNHNGFDYEKQNLVREMACNVRYHMLKEGLIKEIEAGKDTWKYELGESLKKYGMDIVNGKESEKLIKREKTITTVNLAPDEPEGKSKGSTLYK